LSSELKGILRRLKPEKWTGPLTPRETSALPFIGGGGAPPKKLLYDSTVYVDILQGRFPQDGETTLRATEAWHSPVTEAESVAPFGMLDPDDPRTKDALEKIFESVERRPAHRTLSPDRAIWLEAGILAGGLARLQGYGHADRRRALNDALIFSTARKNGCTVLTRNLKDFDFLQQLDPDGRVLFYSQV